MFWFIVSRLGFRDRGLGLAVGFQPQGELLRVEFEPEAARAASAAFGLQWAAAEIIFSAKELEPMATTIDKKKDSPTACRRQSRRLQVSGRSCTGP